MAVKGVKIVGGILTLIWAIGKVREYMGKGKSAKL